MVLGSRVRKKEHKLRSNVNWQGVLMHKDVKQMGVKHGLSVVPTHYFRKMLGSQQYRQSSTKCSYNKNQ
jgi:hypothetical protein